jgi:hypothetical protein
MLIRFESEVGSVTMFGEVAQQLLKMMGHSGTVPGAVLAKDIPQGLDRLKAAVQAEPAAPADQPPEPDEKGEPRVSLRQRAYPLIDLLTRAAERGVDVMWTQS